MIKKILCALISLSFLTSQAFAKNLVLLKDFKIEQLDSKTIWIHYQGSKVKIENLDGKRFKMNNQLVVLSPSDTFEQLEEKLKAAHKKSGNTSAALDNLFIANAHAITPLFAGFIGGIFGLVAGDIMCKNKNPQETEASAGYVTPEPVNGSER